MIFKNQWNLAHNCSHSCQVQMAFALFWTANIGHDYSLDYTQVLHFCLKVNSVCFLIIRCEKSNIYGHFLIVYNKLLAVGKQPLCWVQVRCPCTFQAQSFPASIIKLNKGKLPSSIHHSMIKMAFWMLPPLTAANICASRTSSCSPDFQVHMWDLTWRYKQISRPKTSRHLRQLPAASCTNQTALMNSGIYSLMYLFPPK